MQIRYYFSGFDEVKGFPENLIQLLNQDIQKTNKFVFIPTDFSKKEKIDRNSKGLTETFKKANFNFNNIIVLNENMSAMK